MLNYRTTKLQNANITTLLKLAQFKDAGKIKMSTFFVTIWPKDLLDAKLRIIDNELYIVSEADLGTIKIEKEGINILEELKIKKRIAQEIEALTA